MKFQIYIRFLCLLSACVSDSVTSVLSDKHAVEEGKILLKETRKFTNKELDLVFVLDRSKSITTSGWQNVLIFLHSFLEHFTVNSDNTRIAVISFGTNATIEINDLKSGNENKCSIISKFRKYLRIKIPYGYTATYKALITAREIILADSRSSAKKVVIVVTDGRSNLGPPPIRASVEMRSLKWSKWDEQKDGPQLEIFSFGVHQTDLIELKSISSPLPNHTFHIDSFSQFYDIAKSLHNDEQEERWDVMDKTECTSTCHDNAVCMCGSKSGQYLCVCSPGYQGTGDDCKPCDRGFYKDSTLPFPCKPCPENMTTESIGSTDSSSCVCKLGYYKDGDDCTYRICSESPEIENGYKFNVDGMVHDEVSPTGQACLNTPGTSCHYKCNIGYRLTGDPGLICQANGIWKGSVPECKIVDCGDLKYHNEIVEHGTVQYINTTTTFQSVISTSCNKGWILFGDSTRTCTRFGVWSGTKATCVESRCQPLRKTEGIELFPFNCSAELQYPGTVCRYRCKRGYDLSGPDRAVCDDTGSWMGSTVTKCTDVEAPRIICPEDLTVPLTTSNIAIVYWNTQKPITDDNSGETRLRITGLESHPANLTIGHYTVRYIVEDKEGNIDSCTRNIQVVEKNINLVYCPRNITNRSVSGNSLRVYWQKPVFIDTNGKQVDYQCSRINGSVFQLGSYNIYCAVLTTEAVHNAPSCTFSIYLERKQCEIPPAPYHGSLSCNTGSNDALMICTVKCNSGYDFYYTPQTHYKCDFSGNWILKTPEQFWPDCSRKYHPRRAKMRGMAEFFYYNGNCEENKRVILEKFTSLVQKLSWEICGQSSCTVSNVTVKCGIQSRRRREAYKSKDFPDPMSDDIDFFDVFSIKSRDVGVEEDIETSTKAPVIVKLPTSGLEHTMAVLTSTTESLQSTSTGSTDEEITYDAGDRTTTIELMTTYRNILESSKSVTEDSLKSISSTDAYSSFGDDANSDPKSEDTSSASMTEPTHTSADFTDHEAYTEEPNVTDDATKHPDKQNGSLMIDFLIENETNKTNVTQMDLEEVLDALWKVYDEILLSNISIKKAAEEMMLTPQNLDFDDPSVVSCHIGYIPVLDIVELCVACPRGTKFLNASCEPCAIGFYQNETAQIKCKKCPYGHTTIANGAVSFDNCTEHCPQGSASPSGYKPCTQCEVSTYQDETGQTRCKICPNNTVTLRVGSTTFKDCVDPSLKISCLDGSLSSFCCNDSVCLNGGQCVAVGDDILCNCLIGYSGVRCEIPYGLCQPNPCFNNGSCFQDTGGYSCACRDYFRGDLCETYVSPCEKMTCLNGGSCLDEGYGIFQCYCLHNFTGEMCDVKLDHCVSNSCLNGTCVNGAYDYVCDCVPGYAGRHCDKAINYTCRNLDCQNNGRCIEDVQGPSCSCLPGFSGIRCEFNDDDCSSSLCKNNATCVDGNGEYMCRCMPGFSGQYCEEVVPKNFDLQLDNNLGISYVRYHPVHDLKITDFTITLWFRSYQKNIGVLLSYTDSEVCGDFVDVISVEEKNRLLTFSVMNSKVTTPIDLRPGYWHNVIFDWSSKYGIWHVYVNGTISANGFKLAQGMYLSSSGSLTLGLKENFYGGTRNIWAAFTGEISHFNMYDYIIPEDIIRTNYTNNSCNTELGNLIAWSDSLTGLHGTVTVRNQSRCLDVNECMEGQRCTENNQICKDKPGGYECVCTQGFTGNNCVDPVDECLHINCFNGGYCEDSYGALGAICICPKGFSGKFCEIQESWVCSNSTCINGICEANECKCHRNWRGGNCDVLYKSGCELSPCLTNSTCIPDVFSVEGFRCKCPESSMPYDKNCKPLPCVFSPCLNNGICHDNYDASFNCECVEGYSGTYCEIIEEKVNKSISGCKSNSCNSNGICIENNGNVYCKCDDGYTGKWCENSLPKSSTDGLTTEEEIIVIYTCLSILIIIITATCFLILCYFIKRRRKYPTKHRRLLPVLNNESIGMSILHNPVFTMDDDDDDDKDDDGRQRSASGTYENPYAEPGDIPYIDDFIDVKNNKSNLKQCNIQRAASRNNSKSSNTSNRSSTKSLKKLDGTYLQPIFTKNQLENVGTSEKNKKALLPASQKSFKGKSDIDNVQPIPPEYENQPTDKDPIVSKSIPLLLSEDNPAYVNDPSDKNNDPCIRLQNIIDLKPNPRPNISNRSVNQVFQVQERENIDLVNPTSPTASEDSRTYLHVVEPKPGEFPPHKSKHFEVAPCNRKLPPIPKEKF